MTEEKTKVCTKCGRELPLSEFNKDKATKDGLTYWCKLCYKEHNKIWYETQKHRSYERTITRTIERDNYARKYRNCVKKPSCSWVGGRGAQFELFVCEVCGAEFRRLKSTVDWFYEHQGYLPRFCSQECYHKSRRKSYKTKYETEIERIKKEV